MAVIINRNCPNEIIDSISKRFPSETIVKSITLKNVSGSTAAHPDMQIHFVSDDTAVCAPECFDYYLSALSGVNLISGSITPMDTYPKDIAYNAARLGKYVIANTRYTEPKILEYYNKRGFRILNTNQGYAKCSLAVMSSSAVITGDNGLCALLQKFDDIKCHKTDQARIILEGYGNGFIGGASGLIGETAVFFGEPDTAIKKFLNGLNIEYFCASKGALTDYGSLIYGGG